MHKISHCPGGAADEEAILDFANMVFSMAHESVDFEQVLPKAYRPDGRRLLTHHLLTEDGALRGLIDTWPLTLNCAGRTLRCAYLGTVSVHPHSRGQGYMTELMRSTEGWLRAGGYDLVLLDGDRHRYQPFGYERAGMKYCFQITASALRHASIEERPITFRCLEETDTALIDAAYALYLHRHVTARDRLSFYASLLSWNAVPYAIMEGDTFLGYLDVSEDAETMYELALADPTLLPTVMKAYFSEYAPDTLTCNVGADELAYLSVLEPLSARYDIALSHQLKILHYRPVLEFLLTWKRQYTPMEDGACVMRIDDETYRLAITGGEISVTETTAQPQLAFDRLSFVKNLTTPYYYTYATAQKQEPRQTAPAYWFPLPFFLPEPDAF